MRRTSTPTIVKSAICATVYTSLSLALTAPAFADDTVTFKGKTITMIIPTTAGASTDLSGR